MRKLDDFVLLCHPHCFGAVNKGIWEKSEKESDNAGLALQPQSDCEPSFPFEEPLLESEG